jgi:hypothetical protein
MTDFSTKNIFRGFGFSVANSISDIVSSENMFLKIVFIKMLRIESSTNTESLMETENHFCRTCGFRFTEVPWPGLRNPNFRNQGFFEKNQ